MGPSGQPFDLGLPVGDRSSIRNRVGEPRAQFSALWIFFGRGAVAWPGGGFLVTLPSRHSPRHKPASFTLCLDSAKGGAGGRMSGIWG